MSGNLVSTPFIELPVPAPEALDTMPARITWARTVLNQLSASDLAALISTSRKTVYNMEDPKGTINPRRLDAVARALKVSLRWLRDGVGHPMDGDPDEDVRWAPVIGVNGELRRGRFMPVPKCLVPDNCENIAILPVEENAMSPEISAGSYVLFESGLMPEQDSLAVVRVHDGVGFGDCLVRRWQHTDLVVELKASNPAYSDRQVSQSKVEVLGSVVSVMACLK